MLRTHEHKEYGEMSAVRALIDYWLEKVFANFSQLLLNYILAIANLELL